MLFGVITVVLLPSASGNDDVPSVEAWLSKELAPGAHIGYDPQLMSEHVYKKYSDAVECSGQLLVPLSHNLIDEVWGSERPPRPTNPLIVLATKYSGLQMASSTRYCHSKGFALPNLPCRAKLAGQGGRCTS